MSPDIWSAVLGELEVSTSRANFETWFRNTKLISLTNNVATVTAPNIFVLKRLESHYRNEILDALKKNIEAITDVLFTIENDAPVTTNMQDRPAPAEVTVSVAEMVSEQNPNIAFSEDPGHSHTIVRHQTFTTFVEGSHNRLAYNASQAIAKSPGTLYNPLFIYGGVGLGKTHLMHAIANEVLKADSNKRALYVSSETFTNDYIASIRTKNTTKFKQMYRSVDVLLVDDIQFIANKEGSQEEFFNTFNTLHQSNRQIVLAADRPPTAIPGLEERLSSRFGWGMVADVQAPNLETRMAILQRKSREKGVDLPDNAIEYIATQVQTNIRELEGALNRVIGYCQMSHVPFSYEAAKATLSGLYMPTSRRGIAVDTILETVAQHFGLGMADLLGKKRQQNIIYPRHIAMYVMRDLLGMSYPEIGREMGGRDHTTVMHAVNKITSERSQARVSQDIDAIRERLS